MNTKIKYIILLFVIVLVSILFVVTTRVMILSKITDINRQDRQIKNTQEKVNNAKVLSQDLSEVSSVIVNTITPERELSNLEANEFVTELTGFAKSLEIAVHSISPRPALTQNRIIEQQFSIELECTYVQLGRYIARIESYDYLIRINTLDVRPQSNRFREINGVKHTLYRIVLDLSILKIVKEGGSAR